MRQNVRRSGRGAAKGGVQQQAIQASPMSQTPMPSKAVCPETPLQTPTHNGRPAAQALATPSSAPVSRAPGSSSAAAAMAPPAVLPNKRQKKKGQPEPQVEQAAAEEATEEGEPKRRRQRTKGTEEAEERVRLPFREKN